MAATEQELPVAKVERIAEGLHTAAFHSKTSRALLGKRSEIVLALDELRKTSESISSRIYPIVNDCFQAGTPTCCNCLETFDRESLRFCGGCGVECYCSLSCQSESWKAGHDKCCNSMAEDSEDQLGFEADKRDIKRLATLKNNLMMAGCRCVQSNLREIKLRANEYHQQGIHDVTVKVDLGQFPPDIGITSRAREAWECAGRVKCSFVSPVLYGFSEQVGWDDIVLTKYVPTCLLFSCDEDEEEN